MRFLDESPEQQKFLPELRFSKEEWDAFSLEEQHDYVVNQWHLLDEARWPRYYHENLLWVTPSFSREEFNALPPQQRDFVENQWYFPLYEAVWQSSYMPGLPYSALLRLSMLHLRSKSGRPDPIPGVFEGFRQDLLDAGLLAGLDEGQIASVEQIVQGAFDYYFVSDARRHGAPRYEPYRERFDDPSFGETFALIRTTVLSGIQQIRERRDPLTNSLNRRHGLPLLEEMVTEYRSGSGRTNAPAVCFIDIDLFKQINDQCGHAFGDAILAGVVRRAAAVLHHHYHPDSANEDDAPIIRTGRGSIRPGAVSHPSRRRFDNGGSPPEHPVVRYGGEEFLALMPDVPFAVSKTIANEMRAALADHPFYIVEDQATPGKLIAVDTPPEDSALLHKIIAVTASFGLAELAQSDGSPSDLLARADDCLYVAKGKSGFLEKLQAAGKQVTCAPGMDVLSTRNRLVTFEGDVVVIENRDRAAA